jgi:hypothetical protein
MSRPILLIATLALAATAAGCSADPEAAGRPASSDTERLDGLYTATVPRSPAVPGGLWAMRIDVQGRRVRLTPPHGGDTTLRITGIGASRLRLAPNTACEARAGRRVASRFAWTKIESLLRLRALRAPCRSDAALLTSAPWRAAWPGPASIPSSDVDA